MDKSFWQAIVANDCILPDDHKAIDLLPDLLGFLASPDSELRDDIGYMVFVQWIVRDEHFSPGELRSLIETLTQNLSDESVLLRSFSVLVLSVIAYYDVQKAFLEKNEIADLLDTATQYLTEETDLRGYVEGSGWHHATAHTADLLKFLSRNPKIEATQHEQILKAIFERLTMPVDTIYNHNEDERLTLVILDIMRRGIISVDSWQTWLSDFSTWKETHSAGFSPIVHAPHMNSKHFLRSLYFVLKNISTKKRDEKTAVEALAKTILPLLEETLEKFAS